MAFQLPGKTGQHLIPHTQHSHTVPHGGSES